MTPRELTVVFMGTPDFAVPTLQAILELGCQVRAVVSQPDRPVGRGRQIRQTPIAALAEENGCALYQWPRLNNESYDRLRSLEPDLMVVVAYGKILPQRYLDLPKFGCLNVHSSLLPLLRGAAPIQWSVIRGHRETGVSIMRLDAGMDTGDVALQHSIPIGPDETAGALHDRLAPLGASLLQEAILRLCKGTLEFSAQDHERATHAPMLRKRDGLVDWGESAQRIHDHIRGMSPWPGAFVQHPSGPLKLHGSAVAGRVGAPGVILDIGDEGPIIGCGEGSLCLTGIQRPGKRPVSGIEYARSVQLEVGDPLVPSQS